MNSSGFMSIDLGLRGATVGLSLLIAVVLLRDRPGSTVARLSAALAVGAAAAAIWSAPGFSARWEWWGLVFLALSSGAIVVFWLWARAAFDDDFVLRRRHGALWLTIVGLQLLAVGASGRWPVVGVAIDRTLSFIYLGLALLAAGQAVATWRADLVERRRRLRMIVLIGTSIYIAVGVFVSFSPPVLASGPSIGSLASAFGLCALVGFSGWNLFRAAGTQESSGLLLTTGDVPAAARSIASEGKDEPRGVEPALLRRLERLMSVERAYRREGLTIGSLSAELGVPEYRLRLLINEGLGHRNFNAFLNRYRIEEAKTALADPEQRDVPVLTIAMDAGFQSIGPFNRAFKAATDATPTEFRRLAIAGQAAMPPTEAAASKIGQSN